VFSLREAEAWEVLVREAEAWEVLVREAEAWEVLVREAEAWEAEAWEAEAWEAWEQEAGVWEAWGLDRENLHILWKMHIVSPPGRHPSCVRYQTYRLGISILFLQIVSEHICILSS